MCGWVAGASAIDDPHSGQNSRTIGFPLSLSFEYDFSSPWISSADCGSPTSVPNALPVNFWQSRQWQTPTNSGSTWASYRTAPHRQPPLISIFAASLLSDYGVGQSPLAVRPVLASHPAKQQVTYTRDCSADNFANR